MTPPLLFPDPLYVRIDGWHGDNAIYVLEHYQRCCTSLGWVTIPTGFRSDGLSIPSFAWPIVGLASGPAFRAGLLHDFLYSKASDRQITVTRKQSDELFLEAMYNLGIGWSRNVIYAAVRMAGWKCWKKK